MKSLKLSLLATLLIACSNPKPSCPPGQTECGTTCEALQSSAQNCGACGMACGTDQVCIGGACAFSTCSQPDVYLTCYQGGGLVGMCSVSGEQLPTAVVSSVEDGGPGGASYFVNGQLQGAVFTDAGILWALDITNAQIDIVNVASWPPLPQETTSIAAGVAAYDPDQLLLCDGKVLVLRTATPLLEAFNAGTGTFLGEVSLAPDGGFPYPAQAACDGKHTVYVTDSAGNTLTAVDVEALAITAQTTLPAADQLPPLPDGGLISPSLSAVAIVGADGGTPRVVVALQNLGPAFSAVADSTVFTLDPGLTAWSAPIDPGAQCLNTYAFGVSADQSTVYSGCAGIFHTANATTVQAPNPFGYLGVVNVAAATAGPAVTTTLSNPSSLVLLKNGLFAIGDLGQAKVAFYNPFDGGVREVTVACPGFSDGGVNPLQAISAVVAAP